MFPARLIAAAVTSALAVPAGAGTVTGAVELLGRRGEPERRVEGVVVYVDGLRLATPPQTVTVKMQRKRFEPRVVAVPVGGTVEFPNQDPILHNVFSVSGENHFDLDLYKRPEVGRKTFEHPGVVAIYCNIHPQMSAVVVVRDNPFFALVERDGTFRIDGVPPGRHTLKAWHERAAEEAVAVIVVPEQGTVGAALSLDASKYRRTRHKNKFGKDYERDEYD